MKKWTNKIEECRKWPASGAQKKSKKRKERELCWAYTAGKIDD
jgi:hypothetical protein